MMIPSFLRIGDMSIMHQVTQICTSTKALQRFNIVCQWLRVYSITEITTADGRYIRREAWNGIQSFSPNTLWPYQECPNNTSIQIWRRLLSRAFLQHHHHQKTSDITKNLTFVSPLKEWEHTSTWFRSQ